MTGSTIMITMIIIIMIIMTTTTRNNFSIPKQTNLSQYGGKIIIIRKTICFVMFAKGLR